MTRTSLCREDVARLIALAGLGTTTGGDRRTPPTEQWDQGEWERRILECSPTEIERRSFELADLILAGTGGNLQIMQFAPAAGGFDKASFVLGWRARETGYGSFVSASEDPDAGLERAWAARADLAASLRIERMDDGHIWMNIAIGERLLTLNHAYPVLTHAR